MTTIPNKVLVVKQFNTAGTGLQVGDLVVLDGEKGSVISAAAAVDTKKIQFGLVKREAIVDANPAKAAPAYIVKTKAFTRDELLTTKLAEPTETTEDEYELDFTGLKTAVENMPLAVLQVNLTYSLDARNVKKEESYVIRIADYGTDAAIADRVAALITGTTESWAYAEASGAVVTLTAKKAIDYQPGAKSVNSPFPYNQTKMHVTAFHKDSESALANHGTNGIAITRTSVADPGMNNPYVIRDHEKAAAGYDSAHFFHVYPNQRPMTGLTLTASGDIDDTVKYNCVSFAADIKYRAADTNYVKTTTVHNSIYGDAESFDAGNVLAVLNGTY